MSSRPHTLLLKGSWYKETILPVSKGEHQSEDCDQEDDSTAVPVAMTELKSCLEKMLEQYPDGNLGDVIVDLMMQAWPAIRPVYHPQTVLSLISVRSVWPGFGPRVPLDPRRPFLLSVLPFFLPP